MSCGYSKKFSTFYPQTVDKYSKMWIKNAQKMSFVQCCKTTGNYKQLQSILRKYKTEVYNYIVLK